MVVQPLSSVSLVNTIIRKVNSLCGIQADFEHANERDSNNQIWDEQFSFLLGDNNKDEMIASQDNAAVVELEQWFSKK
jgi:hypothetical protein